MNIFYCIHFIRFFIYWRVIYIMNYELRKLQILCKAANDVSGNVPGDSPSGMSVYERTIETLTTLFPLWVCLLALFLLFYEYGISELVIVHFVIFWSII